MTLLNQSVQVYGKIPNLFETLRAGQAPEKFSREFLRDIGFKSSNHHAFIPLLKGLGFLTADGVPTDRYREFLDIVPTQDWIKQRMTELEKARNFIAHNRMLLPSEFQRIYMYISDWNKVIGL